MFHRKPVYVSFEDIKFQKDNLSINTKKSLKKSSVALVKQNAGDDQIVSWLEMPVNIGKKKIGYVGACSFDGKTGNLKNIELSQGVIAGAILGKNEIAAKDVEGYSAKTRAIMLKDGATIREHKEGVAEKAGKTTSYVVHKVKKTSPKVIDTMQDQSDKLHNMFKEFKTQVKKGMEDE